VPTPYEPAAAGVRAGTPAAASRVEGGPVPPTGPQRPPLVRDRSGGWTPGVCGAIARHLGVSRRMVRWVFVLLALAGGAGVAAYIFLWALTPEEDLGHAVAPGHPVEPRVSPERRRWVLVLVGGLGLVILGGILLTPVLGGSLRDSVLLPLFVIAVGAIVAWSNLDEAQRSRWLAGGHGGGWMRLALGLALALTGILVIVTRGQSVTAVWDALLAAAAVLVGILLVAAPWAVRLWQDFRREQVAAARATERADIAAHLHDSVLQTLALIQRQSSDAGAVTRLARAQERELRSWLYSGPQGSQESLAAAVTEVAHEVEDLHGVPIDLVVTGDRPFEQHGAALSRAMREALLNAVRHGRTPVTAYVEIGPSGVDAFVRDRGDGFDLDAVPEDRLGVRQSVLGRMERHGGSARVRRRDDGTEVELRLPALEGDQT
jgi:signal transduction histidine kinase/phage shock protein PspC (stress-responsive transcriptional regulator)